MDIQKLITMGRLERSYELNGVTFYMATPKAEDVAKIVNNIDLLAACITKIDDKQFLIGKDKEGLRTVLKEMQGMTIKKLADYAEALIAEQSALFNTEDDSKK